MSATNPNHDTVPDGPTRLAGERQCSPTPWPALPVPRVPPRQGALPAPPSPAPDRKSSLAPAPTRSPALFDATIQLAESDLRLLDEFPLINPLATIQLAESDLCLLTPQSSLPPLLPRAWAPLEALVAERRFRQLLRPRLISTRFLATVGAAVAFCGLAWLTFLLCGTGPVPGVDLPAPTEAAAAQPVSQPATAPAPPVVVHAARERPAPPEHSASERSTPSPEVKAPTERAVAPAVKTTLRSRTIPRQRTRLRRRRARAAAADAILASARIVHRQRTHIVRKTVDPFEE